MACITCLYVYMIYIYTYIIYMFFFFLKKKKQLYIIKRYCLDLFSMLVVCHQVMCLFAGPPQASAPQIGMLVHDLCDPCNHLEVPQVPHPLGE